MKAILTGKIKAMGQALSQSASMVQVTASLSGNVEGAKSPEAKQISCDFSFLVKEIVAQELRYGQEVTVTVTVGDGGKPV